LGRLPDNAVAKVLLADKSGTLWVGTAAQGLFYWTGETFENVPTSQSEITCLFEDREANIWAGTEGGGLNLIRPRMTALVGKEGGLPAESVLSVTEDAAGNLWAAFQDGTVGMAKEGRWQLVNIETNRPDFAAACVAADTKGGVWVGTFSRGLWRYQEGVWRAWSKTDGLASETIRSLLAAANGDVWVASSAPNCLHRLRAGQVQAMENSTPLGPIRALAEGADGTIWVGTSEGQIHRLDGSTLIAEPAISQAGLLSVRCLLATPDGTLWIGYAGDGLGIFQNGQYQRFTAAAGLDDDYISQILADDRGNLWLNGNRGLSRVSIVELNAVFAGRARRIKPQPYGKNDGLPALRPARDICPSACRSRDGHLWFATHNGLVAVRPDNSPDNPVPPPLELEQVTVEDQIVAIYQAGAPLQTRSATNAVNLGGLNSPLRLPPDYRRLDIDFAALSFTSPERVQFRYRLQGFDKNWVEADSSHHAIYPRLPAGGYQFHVIACNNSGVWNETGRQLRIVVTPFFWETWWFRIGSGLILAALFVGSAYAVSRRRYRQKLLRLEAKRALEQERTRIAKDIHDDLGASLTRISLLSQPAHSRNKDAETLTASLVKIHQTSRDLTHAMGEVVWAVNPEHDTYESLSNYLGLYAQKFLQAAGLRCRINMPMQMPRQPVSAEIRHNLFLAFKEALNNVAKHAEASEVRVELALRDFGFELLVADNGKGFSRDAKVMPLTGNEPFQTLPGNGLANMRTRLQEIGGACEVQSESGRGTTITFRVNLRARRGHP
ncbi:MAG: ATP-binding protein, partial [Verrucomicrobia bacterium]|nr:ATP-binding protein [Verrucomicrobiota bacterium]